MLSDGQLLPITGLYFEGEEVEDRPDSDAFAVVAGPDKNGKWWAVDMLAFTSDADALN